MQRIERAPKVVQSATEETIRRRALGAAEGDASGQLLQTPGRALAARRDLLIALGTAGLDLVAVLFGYLLARDVRLDRWWDGVTEINQFNPTMLITLLIWVPVLYHYDLYDRRRFGGPVDEMSQLFHAVAVSTAIVVVAAFAFKLEVSRGWIAMLFIACYSMLALNRLMVGAVVRRLYRRRFTGERTVIVGINDEARALARTLGRKREMGYDVCGFIGVGSGTVDSHPVLGTIDDLVDVVNRTEAAVVIVAGTSVGPEGLAFIDRTLQRTEVRLRVSPGLPHVAASHVMVEPVDGLALLSLRRARLSMSQNLAKRTLDITVGSLLLLAALPVMLAVALAVKLSDRGPVFFKQTRVGENGRDFTMWKFRTMVVNAEAVLPELQATNEADGGLFKIKDDPRVTRVGRVLRPLALDELPQLFNVLRGSMSMVGPRPALPSEVALWTGEVRERLRVKPGCTGLWQVSGRHDLPYDDYVRFDLFYVENWSVNLDIRVIARTIPALLARRGSF